MSTHPPIAFPRVPDRTALALPLAGATVCLVLVCWGQFGAHLLFHLGLLTFACGLILIIAGTDHPDLKVLFRAFFVAYAIRLIVTLVWHAFSADGLFFLDDVTYDTQATALVASIPISELRNAASYLGSENVAYPVMLSFVYRWLGHSVLWATLMNAIFGAATAPVAYWAAYELSGDRETSRKALWFAAIFLYDVGWGMFLMRDVILMFLFSFSMAATLSLLRRRSVKAFFAAVVSIGLLGEFRFYCVHILLASAAVAGFLKLFPDKPRVRWVALTSSVAGGALAALLFITAFSLEWLQEHVAFIGALLLRADAFQAKDVFQLLIPSASVQYVRGLALGTLRYSFHPLAWVFWDIDWIGTVLYPGMYVIYFLLPFFFIGLWLSLKKLQPLYVLFFAPLFFQALIQIHLYQGGDRQRMMVDMLFVVAAAIGWQHRHEYEKAVRVIYMCFFAIVGLHLAWHFVRYLI